MFLTLDEIISENRNLFGDLLPEVLYLNWCRERYNEQFLITSSDNNNNKEQKQNNLEKSSDVKKTESE
jgi:hypothetical protein